MGCKLSIHVANPEQEALKMEVETLRKTVLDLQTVVRNLEKSEKIDKAPLLPQRSGYVGIPEPPSSALARSAAVVSSTGTATFDNGARGGGGGGGVLAAVPNHQANHHNNQNDFTAIANAMINNHNKDIVLPPLASPDSEAFGEVVVPELRVPLKPTEIVANVLQAAHVAERNALLYLMEHGNDEKKKTTDAWRDYQKFCQQYNQFLYGPTTTTAAAAATTTTTTTTTTTDNQEEEGGLLHFLGLSRSQLDKDNKQQAEEAAHIKAIEESFDWRDDAKQVLARYRDARIAQAECVEDAVLPRLEALEAAAAEEKDELKNNNNNNGDNINDNDSSNDSNNNDTMDENLDEMTKSILFTHVLYPLAQDAVAFEFFVRYVTRALERPGPDKSAIRPFQNALKAMASTRRQAELYKSWITQTRRSGVLLEQAKAKEEAAKAAIFTEDQPPKEEQAPLEQAPKEDTPMEQPAAKEEETKEAVLAEQSPNLAAF